MWQNLTRFFLMNKFKIIMDNFSIQQFYSVFNAGTQPPLRSIDDGRLIDFVVTLAKPHLFGVMLRYIIVLIMSCI